jgi:hypothetical protein
MRSGSQKSPIPMMTPVGVAVGVGGGVNPATHAQLPETMSQCPSSHADKGQIVPGVHGGQRPHEPLQGDPLQGSVAVGVDVGVAVGVVRGTQRHIVHPPSDSHTFS